MGRTILFAEMPVQHGEQEWCTPKLQAHQKVKGNTGNQHNPSGEMNEIPTMVEFAIGELVRIHHFAGEKGKYECQNCQSIGQLVQYRPPEG